MTIYLKHDKSERDKEITISRINSSQGKTTRRVK